MLFDSLNKICFHQSNNKFLKNSLKILPFGGGGLFTLE
jgi:hypothetical protein